MNVNTTWPLNKGKQGTPAYVTQVMARIDARDSAEESYLRPILRSAGYGRVIQLCREHWTEVLGSPTRSNMEPDLPATFGELLRHVRAARRMSLDDVATAAGMSKTQVWQLERGTSEPRLGTFVGICNALRIDPAKALREMRRNAESKTPNVKHNLRRKASG